MIKEPLLETKETDEDQFDNCLCWKISHPKSLNVSCVFGVLYHLSEGREFVLADMVSKLKEFVHAEMLLTEMGDLEESYYTDHLSSKQATYQRQNNLAQELVAKAKHQGIPVYPLESIPTAEPLVREGTHKDFKRPKNLLKTAAVVGTWPVGLPYFFIHQHRKAKRDRRRLEEFYMNEHLENFITRRHKNRFICEERNLNWLHHPDPEIDKKFPTAQKGLVELLKTRNVFVAVGAKHLPFEYGLLSLLKKEGFEVSPIFDWKTRHLLQSEKGSAIKNLG